MSNSGMRMQSEDSVGYLTAGPDLVSSSRMGFIQFLFDSNCLDPTDVARLYAGITDYTVFRELFEHYPIASRGSAMQNWKVKMAKKMTALMSEAVETGFVTDLEGQLREVPRKVLFWLDVKEDEQLV